MSQPLLLSPPALDHEDEQAVLGALRSGWAAPVGPEVEAFEDAMCTVVGTRHALATNSGTSALHLALLSVGVGPGDDVMVSDLSFVAAPNAIRYVGARPVLVDCERSSWQVDPDLVVDALASAARSGRLPKALVVVHLYGQVADMDRLTSACARYGVALIEDAAEALGAAYKGRQAGSVGDVGIFSFNGNKIVTTSGGGMMVTDNSAYDARARHLCSQARLPTAHYEHDEVGFNYRLSSVLAALGRSQLRHLSRRVSERAQIRRAYRGYLEAAEGLSFMPDAGTGRPSWWLTCVEVDSGLFGASRDDVIASLAAHDIESRPAWKPMHLQAPYRNAPCFGGDVGHRIFERGICLPSGPNADPRRVRQVAEIILSTPEFLAARRRGKPAGPSTIRGEAEMAAENVIGRSTEAAAEMAAENVIGRSTEAATGKVA